MVRSEILVDGVGVSAWAVWNPLAAGVLVVGDQRGFRGAEYGLFDALKGDQRCTT